MEQGNRRRRAEDGDEVRMERLFVRDYGALAAIFDFVAEFAAAGRLEADRSFEVQLMVEEIFTNMVKYNKEGKGDIPIELERSGERLRIRLTDVDAEAFDLTQVPELDPKKHVASEKAGGWGLHLVRKIADDISYEYVDRRSKVTITKRVGS